MVDWLPAEYRAPGFEALPQVATAPKRRIPAAVEESFFIDMATLQTIIKETSICQQKFRGAAPRGFGRYIIEPCYAKDECIGINIILQKDK